MLLPMLYLNLKIKKQTTPGPVYGALMWSLGKVFCSPEVHPTPPQTQGQRPCVISLAVCSPERALPMVCPRPSFVQSRVQSLDAALLCGLMASSSAGLGI